jgi:starch synthase (maltosyl-transferring)
LFPVNKTVVIEAVQPALDSGRYPIKLEVGDRLTVSADIFTYGHDVLTAWLRYRAGRKHEVWSEVAMKRIENERWSASFTVEKIGCYQYTVQAYPDGFLTWLQEVKKKHQAGVDVHSELLEGRRLLVQAQGRASSTDRALFAGYLERYDSCLEHGVAAAVVVEMVETHEFSELMGRYPDRRLATECERVFEVTVDRVRARFAAWYEMFPRSQGGIPGRSGTFKDCEERLEDIKRMGFEVIYFPPVHPIGVTNRKGPNNSLVAGPEDPGCPYAIGSLEGGHKALEPGLGSVEDFDQFVAACHAMNMEVALDFAVQCSPDHPYAREHPDWFYKRPDGTIKYAENPPKKYEDIYPLNFNCEDRAGLWEELKSVIEFWIEHGVHIFRVDNPHTKPLVFWEWLIEEIKRKTPEAIFLAEAFTHPKMMRALAKAGFTQSYTYFTWRNHKWELIDYLTELTQGPMREYFRGNFFVNTPDILPIALQQGGKPMFKIRVTLAATLSSVYGIYSGYELCEHAAIAGREEYLNSEKYEYKVWDWDRPGNIKEYISRLNRIRQENPALHEYDNLEFYRADNDDILWYGKRTPSGENIILVAVNLNPHEAHESFVYVPTERLGIGAWENYEVHDLITDARYLWKGERNFVRLDPNFEVAHVLRISR